MTAPKTRASGVIGPAEAEIQRQIEIEIGAEPDLLLIRNSIGVARYTSREGREFTVPYGLGVGSPDLVGILKNRIGLGVWLCLEVKRPGESLRPEQAAKHEQWRAFGALIYTVTSREQARRALEQARRAVNS